LGPKSKFFGNTTSQTYDDAHHRGLRAVIVTILLGDESSDAQALPAWENGHAVDGVGLGQMIGHQRIPSFVEG